MLVRDIFATLSIDIHDAFPAASDDFDDFANFVASPPTPSNVERGGLLTAKGDDFDDFAEFGDVRTNHNSDADFDMGEFEAAVNPGTATSAVNPDDDDFADFEAHAPPIQASAIPPSSPTSVLDRSFLSGINASSHLISSVVGVDPVRKHG